MTERKRLEFQRTLGRILRKQKRSRNTAETGLPATLRHVAEACKGTAHKVRGSRKVPSGQKRYTVR